MQPKRIAYMTFQHIIHQVQLFAKCCVAYWVIVYRVHTLSIMEHWVIVWLFVLMWFTEVIYMFAGLFVCSIVTYWYSLSDISCRLHNPSPVMGNQLDHQLHSHGNIQAQIIPHLTAFNTSINYSLTPLKFIWTTPKTPAASSIPKELMKSERKRDCRLLCSL